MNCLPQVLLLSSFVISSYGGCKSSEFKCDNGGCFRKQYVCDAQKDCPDHSDESPFLTCIPWISTFWEYEKLVCGGKDDFGDQSDEMPRKGKPCTKWSNCTIDECRGLDGSCALNSDACNGYVACARNDVERRWECKDGEHPCPTGKCVGEDLVRNSQTKREFSVWTYAWITFQMYIYVKVVLFLLEL